MIELVLIIVVFGVLLAPLLHWWPGERTVEAMLQDESLAAATAINMPAVPPFYQVERKK